MHATPTVDESELPSTTGVDPGPPSFEDPGGDEDEEHPTGSEMPREASVSAQRSRREFVWPDDRVG